MDALTVAPAGAACCGGPAEASAPGRKQAGQETGAATLHLVVEGAHCAACIQRIEQTLGALPGVLSARLNLSTGRASVTVDPDAGAPTADEMAARLTAIGYPARPFDGSLSPDEDDAQEKTLLRALAVAGFAAANVMLLSISVWAGSDMSVATRDFLHWISALIALPAVAYAGLPFYRSAWTALRTGGVNMDVPISLAVILAAGMSLAALTTGGGTMYFDAAVTLLFFLLVGRYLDRRVRGRARSAAQNLLSLQPREASVLRVDGQVQRSPLAAIEPGVTVVIARGERIPVDGVVRDGASDVDTALVTGETVPVVATPGTLVFAGTMNETGPLKVEVTAAAENTLLAEIVRLMEAAEQNRARYVRIADRIAGYYAPTVHILAAGTFAGWFVFGAAGWETALLNAIAVLIITCPCALGLAVPAVQVAASERLFRGGVLLKSADALERLAAVDSVVFDKTGTLTKGLPELENRDRIPGEDLTLAARLAAHSRHPLARALCAGVGKTPTQGAEFFTAIHEEPGAGLSATAPAGEVRLGSRSWCKADGRDGGSHDKDDGPEFWLARTGHAPRRFTFTDALKPDASGTVRALRRLGCRVELISGDRPGAVERAAARAGIDTWSAGATPPDKIERLDRLAGEGRRTLMVGDGLNDGPALAHAYVSMSPAAAADISRTAADFVFRGEGIGAVAETLSVARRAKRLMLQNFALAFAYNAVAVPFAIAGYVTPLVAAVAMSASSIAVTLNAMRLHLARPAGGMEPD